MNPVELSELADALEFVSGGALTEHRAYLSLATGAIYWVTESGAIDEDAPDDLDEAGRYLEVPTKSDLGLGRPLALRFAEDRMPNEYPRVRQFFAHRGAYARFKDLLEAHGQLDAWYAFEAERTEQALADWCEAHEIRFVRTKTAPETE